MKKLQASEASPAVRHLYASDPGELSVALRSKDKGSTAVAVLPDGAGAPLYFDNNKVAPSSLAEDYPGARIVPIDVWIESLR